MGPALGALQRAVLCFERVLLCSFWWCEDGNLLFLACGGGLVLAGSPGWHFCWGGGG